MIAFRDWWGRDEPGDAAFEAGVRRLLDDPNTDYLLAGDPAVGVCGLRYRFAVWTGSRGLLASRTCSWIPRRAAQGSDARWWRRPSGRRGSAAARAWSST